MNQRGGVLNLLAPIVCLALIVCVSARQQGGGGHYWHTMPCYTNGMWPPCPGSPSPQPSGTSAYTFISSQPDLSAAKALIDELGLQSTLSGSFAGTLFVPNNQALTAYVQQFQTNITFSDGIGKQFLDAFFGKLLQYHTLPSSVSTSQLQSGTAYNTVYVSSNGNPHKVTWSGSALVDEQQQSIALTGVSSAVMGGGYVYAIAGVLQPNDIFPSIKAALSSSSDFSTLRGVVNTIDTGLSIDLASMLEQISGTFAVPNNQAFNGIPVSSLSADALLQIITYHTCAFKRQYRLLYTPFIVGNKPGRNPCLTVFSRAFSLYSYGLRWTYNSATDMFVSYATGVFPNNLQVDNSNIVLADVTLPTHSLHVVSSLIIPPSNISGEAVSAASTASRARKQSTKKLIQTLKRSMRRGPTLASEVNDEPDASVGDTDSDASVKAPGSTSKRNRKTVTLNDLVTRTRQNTLQGSASSTTGIGTASDTTTTSAGSTPQQDQQQQQEPKPKRQTNRKAASDPAVGTTLEGLVVINKP